MLDELSIGILVFFVLFIIILLLGGIFAIVIVITEEYARFKGWDDLYKSALITVLLLIIINVILSFVLSLFGVYNLLLLMISPSPFPFLIYLNVYGNYLRAGDFFATIVIWVISSILGAFVVMKVYDKQFIESLTFAAVVILILSVMIFVLSPLISSGLYGSYSLLRYGFE